MNKILLQKSRSYDGVGTKTDHKLVKATFKLDWWRMKQKHKPSETVNIEKLKEPVNKHLYASELNDKLRQSSISNMSPNEAWKRTSGICKETAKRVLGTKEANWKLSTSK